MKEVLLGLSEPVELMSMLGQLCELQECSGGVWVGLGEGGA